MSAEGSSYLIVRQFGQNAIIDMVYKPQILYNEWCVDLLGRVRS